MFQAGHCQAAIRFKCNKCNNIFAHRHINAQLNKCTSLPNTLAEQWIIPKPRTLYYEKIEEEKSSFVCLVVSSNLRAPCIWSFSIIRMDWQSVLKNFSGSFESQIYGVGGFTSLGHLSQIKPFFSEGLPALASSPRNPGQVIFLEEKLKIFPKDWFYIPIYLVYCGALLWTMSYGRI